MKITRFALISLSAVFILIVPLSVRAYTLKTENSIYVGGDQMIEGNLYAAGNSITINGNINGDLICAGQIVNVSGHVAGDIICAAEAINITGETGGSIRVAGNSVNLNGPVARNVQVVGMAVVLGKNASVGWDTLILAASGDIQGQLGGDLHGTAGSLTVSGRVAGDVKFRVDERIKGEKYAEGYTGPKPLRILPKAEVGGNVYYVSGVKADIADSARIGGEIGYSAPQQVITRNDLTAAKAWAKIIFLFAALVVGLVLISIGRERLIALTDLMINEAGSAIGWGMIVTFLTPIIALMLILTLIGIPLAVILLAFWLIALYLGKIITGIMAGRIILGKLWNREKESLIWAMIVGIILCYLVFSLPYVGWIFALSAFWWGLGGIWLYFKKG